MANLFDKKEYGINDIIMKRPASVFRNRWRDGTPIGSGMTGILFYGGTSSEHFVVHRSDLWFGGVDAPVPDVTEELAKMRALQKEGKYKEADWIMHNALKEKGYATSLADMRVLGDVTVRFLTDGIYSKYTRVVHMDTAEAEVSYLLDKNAFCRKYFMSRPRDIAVIQINSEIADSFVISSGSFISGEGREPRFINSDRESAEYKIIDGVHVYSSMNMEKYFGIAFKVVSDGATDISSSGITVKNAKTSLLIIKAFSNEKERNGGELKAVNALNACPTSYRELFEENLKEYAPLYNSANLKLYYGNKFNSNEGLLEEARYDGLSTELAEKLWRFSRYTFISGTANNCLPFPLYGIWPCGYARVFTHNVANENVQSIYWHTDVGGLSPLVKPLIDYYYGKMDGFRENARKLYGCKGIFVGTYTTPMNSTVAWYVPVILHFLGVAGWLSQHFYRYYLYTGDEQTLKEKILPFMIETAEFYEDFHRLDKEGKILLYPAVSPENSPAEYRDKSLPHAMSTTLNPTIEIAILKELLTNLLKIASTHPELNEKVEGWKKLLKTIPEYKINEDGAIAEWMTDDLHDAYDHRHLSHVYPLFPGTEIIDAGDDKLMKAFEKAVDLREFGSYCGWSLPHMSAIYSRLNRAESAYDTVNMLSKVCLLDNFFTMGYDFRDMGVTVNDCGDEFGACVQLDALLSFANAVQEMLMLSTEKVLKLLPACPKKFGVGEGTFRFTTGTVSMKWDIEKKECHGKITALRDTKIDLILPFDTAPRSLNLVKGETFDF